MELVTVTILNTDTGKTEKSILNVKLLFVPSVPKSNLDFAKHLCSHTLIYNLVGINRKTDRKCRKIMKTPHLRKIYI